MSDRNPRSLRLPTGIILVLGLAEGFLGCGGGSSSNPPPAPVVQGMLFGFPPGTQPPTGLSTALVTVLDGTSGASITTATVTVNGVALTYNAAPSHQEYEGSVAVAPGAPITLSVKTGSTTCTATGTQFTSFPTLSEPQPGDFWAANAVNTLAWSGGAPLAGAVYMAGLLDGADPDGVTPLIQTFATTTTSWPVSATTLTAGTHYAFAGLVASSSVANAGPNSGFDFGAFNYAPVTVYSWTQRAFGSGVLRGLAWSGTRFAAAGLTGTTGDLFTSPDGLTWTPQAIPAGTNTDLAAITWAGTQFVAVGDQGTVVTSPDGTAWTRRASGASLYGVAWSGTTLVGVGPFGVILTSPDGTTWTPRTSGTSNDLYGVAWSGSQFLAVGLNGTILSSPDGVTWTPRASGASGALSAAAWSGSLFVVTGESGTILTSPDGAAWTPRTSGTHNSLYAVAWTGSRFLAAGNSGAIASSPDGLSWSSQVSGTVFNLYAVASEGNQIVVAGDSTILTVH